VLKASPKKGSVSLLREILRRLARLRMTPLCAIAPDKLAGMKLRMFFAD